MIRPTGSYVHVQVVEESFLSGLPGSWIHPVWANRFPWLVQGTTGRGHGESKGEYDFGVFMDPPAPGGRGAWEDLGAWTGFARVVHSRQVHHRKVLVHSGAGGEGAKRRLHLASDADGHVTAGSGILLGVTIADCVPVFLVASDKPAVGLLHAGWRGVAAGVLEEGIEQMGTAFGVRPQDLHLHLGPAICGGCYEVGPEVFEGLGLLSRGEPETLDLRAVLAGRALGAGVEYGKMTCSSWCTRCSGSPFFSHRRGDRERQVAYLGIRPAEGERLGLCDRCRWARTVQNRRGSRFLLCKRAAEDPRLARYPRLPVLRCHAFQPTDGDVDPL